MPSPKNKAAAMVITGVGKRTGLADDYGLPPHELMQRTLHLDGGRNLK